MQSRRRFFCARVELVQLARAFLCPSTGHAGTMDRAQEPQPRDSGAQVDTAAPGCKLYHTPPPTAATEPRNRARVQGYRQAPKQATEPPTAAHRGKQSTAPGIAPPETPGNAPQSRPGRGCYPLPPAAKTPHRGAQSRPQRASRRGYRNAGEGKPTAATAPA